MTARRTHRGDLPITDPPGDTRLRKWFFDRGIDPRSGTPRRRSLRAVPWAIFLSMLVARNPLVRRRPMGALARFWLCEVLRARGRDYEVEVEGARFRCPPWSALGPITAATGSHEADEGLLAALLVGPGDGVIDAGANIGLFTLPLAVRGASVLAFEPADEAADLLAENAVRSEVADRVQVVRAALSDHEGTGVFTTDRDAQNLLVGDGDHGFGDRVTTVRVRTLDSIAAERSEWFGANGLRLLKIDVEGEDERVLRGSRRLVDRHRPLIMIETRDGGHAIRAWLGERGYRTCWYDALLGRLSEVPEGWMGNFSFHTNIFAIPEEQLPEVSTRISHSRFPGPPRVGLRWRGVRPERVS